MPSAKRPAKSQAELESLATSEPATAESPNGAPLPAEPAEPGELDDGPDEADLPTSSTPERRVVPSKIGVVLAAILTGSILFLGGFTLGAHVAATPGTPASEETRFQAFWDTYDLINSSYAGSPKPTKDQLVRAAIDGMMKALNDPFSYYENPDAFQQSLLDVSGQQIGVGVELQVQPTDTAPAGTDCNASDTKIGSLCELAIVKPIPGSPASKAGILAGDVLSAIDGVSLNGLTIDAATAKIKGKKGTPVKLTLLRGGSTVQIAVVRDLFDIPVVDTATYANNQVQYISLTKVEEAGYQQFDAAVADALKAGRKYFIIDLRGNGGGYVQDAIKLASEFIGSGPVVYQQTASGNTAETDALPGGRATASSIRVAILTDGGTASAAEILAGALQARGRAVLVGETTYGKGVVQEWLPLPNGAGGIHLTVARWLTPNHVWIQHKGLAPDIAASPQGARAGTDPVLDAALEYFGFQTPTTSPSPAPSGSPAPSPAPSLSPTPTLSPAPSAS